jgi:PAS domain S-box-containing protein
MTSQPIDVDGDKVAGVELLAAALRTVAQPVWVVDRDGLIRFANAAAIDALGYSDPDELIGRDSHQLIHHHYPDGRPFPAADCPMLHPRTTGQTVSSDLDWFFRRGGSMFPVSYVSAPLEMEDGRGAVVAFMDIEARMAAEQALREREARLADEQAALRRLAVLVGRQPTPDELFTAVTEEICRLLDADLAAMHIFLSDATARCVASCSTAGPMLPVGTRLQLDGDGVAARIFRTGAAARMDHYLEVDDETADLVRGLRVRSAVGAPILVDGKLWGALIAATRDVEPLRDDAESRIAAFTELVASAVSSAEAREAVHRLADEQAALRRVATLVAQEVRPAEMFSAVTEAVARVIDVPVVSVVRYEADGRATELSSFSLEGPPFSVGTRWSLEGTNVLRLVLERSDAARIDDYTGLEGEIADLVRRSGVRSTVGIPIVVAGRVWGAMVVSGTERLRDDTESRLADFTELLATAIENAESRDAVERLADEQAALRRIATLVAQRVAPGEVFTAVSQEVERVFAMHETLDLATVVRFDPGPECVLVGAAKSFEGLPIGSRWEPKEVYVSTKVLRTGRSARVEESDLLSAPGRDAEALRRQGLISQVGSPIIVEGRLWGAITMNANETLPADTDERLAKFTALVATAISNAESRQAVAQLAEEQAALRRVATLVAREASEPSSADVFAAVTEEVGTLLRLDFAQLHVSENDGTATCVGAWGRHGVVVPIGTRFLLDGDNPATRAVRTQRPARMDDYSLADGELADIVRAAGVQAAVATPINVEGRLWGLMAAGSMQSGPLPPGTEERIGNFAELVSTAIANAESRDALGRLAEEQAALRRVATIAARESSPVDVFGAVTEEAARVLETEAVGMLRFEPDETAMLVAQSQTPWDPPPLGTRFTLEGENVVAWVHRTGQSARMDDWANASGSVAAMAQVLGVRSAVATPVIVEGRLWGTMVAVTSQTKPLPADTESRIGEFIGLVATAISNAEGREALSRLAEEQAALRRVATLVAQGVRPVEIFGAVSEEVTGLFGAGAAVLRFEDDDPAFVFVGTSQSIGIPTGARWEIQEGTASSEVYRTGRSARLDDVDWTSVSGPVAEAGRRLGVVSYALSPIVVEGRLWGAMSVASYDEPLPLDTEERLQKFTELVATAIANAESKSELAASRRRIVAASDDARRRIERDLHDGTQQRLVSLALSVRAAEASVTGDMDDLRADLAGIASGLADAAKDLQEISRGIHPAILSDGGLAAALEALARRSTLPVAVEASDARLPEPIEIAAYFVASEALANAAKHAQASQVEVSLATHNGKLQLSIRDDGVGGADPAKGSGLVGLQDRVEALGGTISVDSAPGNGTSLLVTLPVDIERPAIETLT